LLRALGFEANDRGRRGPCPVHGGRNPGAFSWHEDGRWHCFSCGAGGDRIALVRAVRRCSFRDAVEFLAALAGVEFRSRRVSQREIAQIRQRRERAEHAAWRIADETGGLRRYYTDAMHRAERLREQIGNEILRSSTEEAREAGWERLARLAPVCTFFFAGWTFLWDATPETLARFALASPAERQRFILEGEAA
jgi:DNA primase